MSGPVGRYCILALTLFSGACVGSPLAKQSLAAGADGVHTPDVLLVVGELTCDRQPSAIPTEHDLQLLTSTFASIYPHQRVTTLRDPTPRTFAAHIRVPGARPLLVFYSGHATVDSSGVRLCLRGGDLAMEQAVAQVPNSRPSAMWWVNACFSHHVDVRLARVPTAVVGVSSQAFTSLSDRPTLLAVGLAEALRSGDLNRDGLTTDGELFAMASRVVSRQGLMSEMDTDRSLTLRLRRQAKVPLVLFSSPALATALTSSMAQASDPGLQTAWRTHLALAHDLRQPLPQAPVFVITDDAPTTTTVSAALQMQTPFAWVLRRSPGPPSYFVKTDDLRSLTTAQLQASRLGHGIHVPPRHSKLVYFPGFVAATGSVVIDGRSVDAGSLRAVPCQNQQIGQCFMLPSLAP